MKSKVLPILFLLLFIMPVWGQEEINKTFTVSVDRPFEIILNVDAGEVVVVRGESGSSVHVILRYPEDEYRDRISFNEQKNRLRVFVDKRSWTRWRKDNENSFLKVELPFEADILLDARVKAGEISMELGGLRMKELSFSNWAGEVELSFDQPNLIEMDFFDFSSRVGEVRLINLGNARFHKADINGGIGEMEVDFTGDLLDQSMAKVDLDIGEASIQLPEGMGIKMRIGGGFSFLSHKEIDSSLYRRGSYYYSEDFNDMEKKFYVRITPGLGELTINR